jgi:hypothetical protein
MFLSSMPCHRLSPCVDYVLLASQSCDIPDAFTEVGKKYGGGTKYKAVWGRMAQIKEYAKLINEAIKSGIDPITVDLNDAPTRTPNHRQGSYVAVLVNLSFSAQRACLFHLGLIVYNLFW